METNAEIKELVHKAIIEKELSELGIELPSPPTVEEEQPREVELLEQAAGFVSPRRFPPLHHLTVPL